MNYSQMLLLGLLIGALAISGCTIVKSGQPPSQGSLFSDAVVSIRTDSHAYKLSDTLSIPVVIKNESNHELEWPVCNTIYMDMMVGGTPQRSWNVGKRCRNAYVASIEVGDSLRITLRGTQLYLWLNEAKPSHDIGYRLRFPSLWDAEAGFPLPEAQTCSNEFYLVR